MTARLADIAAQAGVSEATVSRVLNGKPGVAAATRAVACSPRSTSSATSGPVRLRQRSAGLVGLITPELDEPDLPGLRPGHRAGADPARATPRCSATQTPGGSTEDELTEMLVDRGVTGIIFVSGLHADTTADMQRYDQLRGQGVPFVLVNGFSAAGAGAVHLPRRPGGDAAGGAPIWSRSGTPGSGSALGPRRFVPGAAQDRGLPARRCRSQLGLASRSESDELIQHSLYTAGGRPGRGGRADRPGLHGVVCASDMMALGAIRAARQRGLDVPSDVSVVGFDDSPLIAFTDPPLTTVRKPVQAMGQAAVRALLEEIGGTPAPHSEFVFLPELVVRGSTARLRAAGS